ncbi:acylneuraminate cytidylyltransferase family protein [Litoricola sp.]|nr:acylneuraminate cytidylyltransferase family protein [Litorivicinus sp.]
MINNESVLAVVTARGGSKRLPDKNILKLNGKPLIAWSISSGIESRVVDKVVVSTDSKKLAEIGQQYGAEVPFMRPHELASDTAQSVDVILHVLDTLEDVGEKYKYLLLLQPTSPMRTARHIEAAFELLVEKNASAVVSVCELEHPIEWTNTLPDDLSMDKFLAADFSNKRSQDFSTRYRLNGAIYVIETELLRKQRSFLPTSGCYAYVMDRVSSVDIDCLEDFQYVEFLMNNREK